MLAFVFPGQGSQYPGMARDLTMCDRAARERVGIAQERTGVDIQALMTTADAATIADPELAQLLVFVSSTVLLDQVRDNGGQPEIVAGHSLGEYTALVAAGSLEWHTALSLVAERGAAMAAEARRCAGTMGAVVGLDLPTVERLCRDAAGRHGTVVVANVNSPRQVVISGTPDAVDAVLAVARTTGALRARRIPVGGAYHSPLMAGAQQRLTAALAHARLAAPQIPFVSSVTGELVTDIGAYREQLLRQVTGPVQWRATVETLVAHGVTEFAEIGPGRVLTGLGRENARGARHHDVRAALRGRGTRVLAGTAGSS